MQIRLPFLGIPSRAPLDGLLAHYEPIAKGLTVIERALAGYLHDGVTRGFMALTAELDSLEAEADKLKRHARNHLPRGLFMAVDKTLYLNCSRSQDDIMDHAQDALHWLAMRQAATPRGMDEDLQGFLAEAARTVTLLRPALAATVALVHRDAAAGEDGRKVVKERIHAVREQHTKVSKARGRLVGAIYGADLDFKDIYQLVHFVDCLRGMSHSAEGCADILRAMIAR